MSGRFPIKNQPVRFVVCTITAELTVAIPLYAAVRAGVIEPDTAIASMLIGLVFVIAMFLSGDHFR